MSVLEQEFFVKQFQLIREDIADVKRDVNDLRESADKRFDAMNDEFAALRTSIHRYENAIGSLYTMMIDMQAQVERLNKHNGLESPAH